MRCSKASAIVFATMIAITVAVETRTVRMRGLGDMQRVYSHLPYLITFQIGSMPVKNSRSGDGQPFSAFEVFTENG
jgi:hypothetical protein